MAFAVPADLAIMHGLRSSGQPASMTNINSSQTERKFLGIYLNDHLAGSRAGLDLARGLASADGDAEVGSVLRELAAEIGRDRVALQRIMSSLAIRPQAYKVGAAWLAEKARRLKLNGTLGARSPLTSLIELEMLQLGVEGKAAGWRTLRSISDHEPRLNPGQLNELIARARHQASQLEDLRMRAARQALARDPVSSPLRRAQPAPRP
jgi:hypothetical protein